MTVFRNSKLGSILTYASVGISLNCAYLLHPTESIGNERSAATQSLGNSQSRTSQSLSQEQIDQAQFLAEHLSKQFRELFQGMSPEAKRGYRFLTESEYLPADFDQEVVDQLVRDSKQSHPLPDFSVAKTAQEQYFALFGLSGRPDLLPTISPGAPHSLESDNRGTNFDLKQNSESSVRVAPAQVATVQIASVPESTKPLQYVVRDGQYVMNCFACHGGDLFGAAYPGAPNTTYLLSSLTDEVRMAKVRLKKTLSHMDMGSLAIPLGENVGTSNAVMFGVALMHYRDADLNVLPLKKPAPMRHHDMDAPAWWTFHRKSHIYIDGFAEKGHRGLMQFMLIRKNGPEKFRAWENEFRDIYAFLNELRPPRYPYPIDREKSERGQAIFAKHCASCHGTYGTDGTYPGVRVPLEEIGTDPVRGQALTSEHRQKYAESWFADYGKQNTIVELDGYVAPPLDGIWASAPYFHNGSVPTLWHVMHPEDRPKIWRRIAHAPDLARIGFQIEEFENLPKGLSKYEKRLHFDTSRIGKSSAGHEFFGELSEDEKEDLLEYLKTL